MDNLATLLGNAASRWGDERAMVFPDGERFGFSRLEALAAHFAGGLAARGVCRGDRVVLYLPNSWQWLVAYHGLARMGAVVIPANILLSAAEVRYMIEDAGARALIVPDERSESLGAAAELVVTPGGAADTISFGAMLSDALLAAVEVSSGDLFTIGYTSGTTGSPKGVMLSHGNVAASVAHTATCHVRHEHDRVYSALPFPHVYGNVVMNACLLTGAELFASACFDAGAALDAISRHRITLFEGVPTMYYQLLAHPGIASADLSSLTRCTVGGQTMPVAKIEAVTDRLGCPLLELWGMTEVAGPAVSHSPYWPSRPGSIGLPFPGTEVRLADLSDRSRAAPAGEAGELLVRGPLATRGYWNRPEATAEAIDAAGWLATGDIATMEPDGYLTIVDRRKDMILTAGYNVYPAELEQAIARHPDVSMVAVAGFADEEKGELAHAFVVRRPGSALTRDLLLAHCRQHLAAYKVPRCVHFVDDLPRTSSGKIVRRALDLPGQSLVKTGT